MIDPRLLEITVCPSCRSPLSARAGEDVLECTDESCSLVYPVHDGVPVLLVEEAQRTATDDPGDGRAD